MAISPTSCVAATGSLVALLLLASGLPAQEAEIRPQPFLRLEPGHSPRGGLAANVAAAGPTIEQALQWLRHHQDADGRWNAAEFMVHDKEATDGAGRKTYDVATTGLVLLAFAREGVPAKDKAAIERGAAWLVKQQQDNGLVGTNQAHDFIYGHTIGTLGLCGAAAATGNPDVRVAAQKAIDYLEKHRNPYAVWRYQPRDNDNDSSVTTWATLVHRAGLDLELQVNRNQGQFVLMWFDQVTDQDGRAGYSKRGERSSRHAGDHATRFPPQHGEAMTAAGLLCRMGLGQTEASHPVTKAAADLLLAMPPEWQPREGKVDHCYWFFASEALRSFGGTFRAEWGPKLVDALVKGQRVDGAFAGSWDAIDPWGEDGGRIYSTALSVLALQSLYAAPPQAPKSAPK